MIKRHYSKYTGNQIDEAVKAIVENKVLWEDFDENLQAYFRGLEELVESLAESSQNYKKQVVLSTHYEFPKEGEEGVLYIATDENKMYYWYNDPNKINTGYVEIAIEAEMPDIKEINGGGAE